MSAFRFVIILILSFLTSISLAQNNREIDSLISASNSFIFQNPEKTIQIGEDILQRKDISNTYKISSYILIANGYSVLNEHEKSIEYALKAQELSQQIKDDANQIRSLGFIGNQFIRVEMVDEAWKYLDQADRLSQTVSLPDSMKYLIGNINLLKAFLYKRSLDCEYAIKHYNKAIYEFSKDEGKSFAGANLGQSYIQKGFCFMSIDKDSAEVSFRKGLADARKKGAKSLECNALIGISQIENLKENYQKSNEILLDALPISKELKLAPMESQIYKLLADNFIAMGDWEQHIIYHNLFNSTEKEVSVESQKSVNDLLQKRTKDKQKIFDSQQNQFRNYELILGFVLLISILISAFFLWNKRKKIHKNQPSN